MTDTDNRRTG